MMWWKSVLRTRISFRVAFLLALSAVLIGCIAGAVQIAADFRDEQRRLHETTAAILATATLSASRAVLTLDDELGDEIVKGLTRRTFITSAQIFDERGDVLATRTREPRRGARKPLWLPMQMGLVRHATPLPVSGAADDQGRLVIEVDEPAYFESFLQRAVNTALLELVKATAFALVAFLILRIAVTAPLVRLAEWFGRIDPARPGKAPEPVPMGDSESEFGLVARAGDAFRASISSLLQDKARYEAELMLAHDRLEALVVERTQALAWEVEERKAAEHSLQETNRNLERLVTERTADLEAITEEAISANAAKTVFLANMSHELRTPLNSVIGFSQMMAAETHGPLPPRYKEYLDIVTSSGEHLLRLIEDVLDMAKVEAGRIELERRPVDPAAIVTDVLAMVAEQARRNDVTLKSEIGDCGDIEADPTRLRQIVINLLSNAIKFSHQGEVVVEVDGDAARCRIRVRDTGIGMTPEDITVALLPFGQAERDSARRRFQGTGLGLPIAKRLVELHGGTLSIDSRPGAGTTVEVAIPRVALTRAAEAAASPARR